MGILMICIYGIVVFFVYHVIAAICGIVRDNRKGGGRDD